MYTFKLRRQTYGAPTLAGISAAYCAQRDASGEGGSTFPAPVVYLNGKVFGYFSYNGRIWETDPRTHTFRDGAVYRMLHDNRVPA